jgi:hypothetical protein
MRSVRDCIYIFKDTVDGEKNYTYTMFVLYPLLSTVACNIMPSYFNAASEFTKIELEEGMLGLFSIQDEAGPTLDFFALVWYRRYL